MIRVAFNNLGYEHLEEAATYRERGPAGFLEAAELGFSAFQYTTGGPRTRRNWNPSVRSNSSRLLTTAPPDIAQENRSPRSRAEPPAVRHHRCLSGKPAADRADQGVGATGRTSPVGGGSRDCRVPGSPAGEAGRSLDQDRHRFQADRISVGDTPGCSLVDDLSGVDEIRPGNFVFNDAMQWRLGSCAEEDIAVAVACPVVARHPDSNELVIYGGAVHLSLSHLPDDRGLPIHGFLASSTDTGWGPIIDGAVVTSLSQEHGIIRAEPGFVEGTSVGDVVNIIPIHSCLTVNLMREYRSLGGEKISCYPLQSGAV